MFSIEEYVTASRTNAEGKLKLVSAVDIMQDCSQLWMKSESCVEEYFLKHHLSQLLASRQMDILRTPEYGEKLTITTSVFECLGVQGFRNTVIYDEEHKPCIVSWTIGAFVDLQTNKLTKIPQDLAATLTIDPKVEMEYLERRIILPNSTPIELPPVEVMRNDIDMNRHMNNAHYVRIAFEYLPPNFEVKRLRIEYKVPARQGDLLYPQKIETENKKIYIRLLNEKGQVHATMEFTQ